MYITKRNIIEPTLSVWISAFLFGVYTSEFPEGLLPEQIYKIICCLSKFLPIPKELILQWKPLNVITDNVIMQLMLSD
jgi:hypothetical protein